MITTIIPLAFRSLRKIAALFISVAALAGCGKGSPNSDGQDTTGAPVETREKVAPAQQPAFAGQTRIGSVKSREAYRVTVLASGLAYPWSLAFLPDGRMLVTEKQGRIRIVSAQGAVGNPISGVPAVRYQGESGLHALAIDPDFATTREVFWTFSEPQGNGSVLSIARARLSDNESTFENVRVIYRAGTAYSAVNHNGSRLLFDAQKRLYASFGERSDDAIRVQAQQLNSALGKILRLNRDGSAAAGNPFAATTGALPEIWSLGHRNPQGLAFHPVTGELWESEHGAQGGDEINRIQSGSNYGWPTIGYGLEYSGAVIGSGTQQTGMEQPVYYWDPAIAPSGMMFYTGDMFPEWKNNLFVAALKGMHLVRLVINNNKVTGEERLLADQNQRIRSVVQGPDGALYVINDQAEGKIYRIAK